MSGLAGLRSVTLPYWLEGREAVDADYTFVANVTRADIEDAVSGRGDKCVLAKAIARTQRTQYVWFFKTCAYIAWDVDEQGNPERIERFMTDRDAQVNIIEPLDDPNRGPAYCVPGNYKMRPPKGRNRLGQHHQRKATGKGHKNKHGHRPHKPVMISRISGVAEMNRECAQQGSAPTSRAS